MPEQIVTPSETPEMSLSDKFIGILSSPGEVYTTVATTEPKNGNWAIPLIIAILMSLIFTYVVFTQPAIQDEMHTQQMKGLQHSVEQGKMTQEQADKAMEFSKPGSSMFLLFGSIGVVFVLFVMVFGYSLAYWIGGKIIAKSSVGFMKVVEVYGLSMFVVVVSTLLSMILIVAMGSLHAQPALSMLVSDFDPMNKTHKLLAAVNLFTFWQLYVVSVGLSKVWNATLGKALVVTGGVWVIWTLVSTFAGFGFGG